MIIGIVQWFVLVSFLALRALIAASVAYFLARAIEKRNREVAMFLSALMVLVVLLLVSVVIPRVVIYAAFTTFMGGICSFKTHQKTGGASQNSLEAFCLMMMVALMAWGINLYLSYATVIWFPALGGALYPSNSNVGYFYQLLQLASIPLVPFLLWAYQHARPRPGIDRHLREGEVDSE